MVTQHSVKCGKQTDQNYVHIRAVYEMYNVGIQITYILGSIQSVHR